MNYGASTDTGQPICKALKDDGQNSAPYRSLFPSLWDNEPSTSRKADAAGKCPILKMKKDDAIYQALGCVINLPYIIWIKITVQVYPWSMASLR